MADNVVINTGTAATVAAEDVGGTEYQRIKIVDGGAAGTLGVVATSAAPAAGTVGLVVRVAGTVGLAPTAMTVNTVSVGNLGTVDATTGGLPANSSTGLIVAIKQGAVIIAQISAGATVVAQISSTVLSVNTAPTIAGASVTIQQGASITGTVSVAGVLATASTPTATASGLGVWLIGGQTATGVPVNITAINLLSVTNIGVVSVTVLPGASISTVGGTLLVSVAASAIVGTIIAVSGITAVSNVSTVNTVLAVSGVTAVSVVSTVGTVLAVSGVTAVSVVSTIGTIIGIQSITTLLGTAIVTIATAGSITALDVARTQFVLMVSSTIASNAQNLLFTAYLGSAQAANTAGVSLFAIPAGKNLRLLNMQVVAAGSASALLGQVQVVFATSAATVTVSAIGGRGPAVAMAGSTTVYSGFFADGPQCDIPATQTVGIGVTVNTSCLIGGIVVQGYIFP